MAHHQREADGGVVRVATADPVPELEHVVGVDAELRHRLGVGRHRHEVLGHRVVAGRAPQSGQEPVPGRGGVGQRLECRERLGADDEERRLGLEVVRGGVEVDRVDVRHETAGQSRLRVVGQGERGHRRAEVRAADPDVDDRRDPLARCPRPGPAADAVGEITHLAEDRLHVADDVLAVDVELAAGWHAQRHVEDRAVLRRVDVVPGEHRVAMRVDVGGVGQIHQEAQRQVGRPLLGVVEDKVRRLRRHAPARSGSSSKRSRRCRVENSS